MRKNGPNKRREFLIKARKKRKLSQKEVSKAININRSTYSHIENGHRNPSLRVAVEISNFFNIDLKRLNK